MFVTVKDKPRQLLVTNEQNVVFTSICICSYVTVSFVSH